MAKNELNRRVKAAEKVDRERREALARARRTEGAAAREVERLKGEMALLEQRIDSQDRAENLSGINTEQTSKDSITEKDSGVNVEIGGKSSVKRLSGGRDTITENRQKALLLSTSTQKEDDCNHVEPVDTASVGINTNITAECAANLYAEGLQARTALHAAEMRASQLQIECANLRGRCHHMEEQLERYEQRVHKAEIEKMQSPRTKETIEDVKRLSKACDGLKMMNARLEQENSSLFEGRQCVEDENRQVVEKCVSLERISEDATAQCEHLTREIANFEQELKLVKQDGNSFGKETDLLTEQVNNLNEEGRKIAKERDIALKECERFSAQLIEMQEDMLKVQKDKLDAEQVLQERTKWEQEKATESENSSRQINELTGLVASLSEERSQLEQSKTEAKSRCSQLENQILALDSNESSVQAKHSRLEEENEHLMRLTTQADSELQRLEKQVSSLQESIGSMEEDKAKTLADRSHLESEAASLRETIAKMELVQNEGEVLHRNLKEEISSMRKQESDVVRCMSEAELENTRLKDEILSFQDTILTLEKAKDKTEAKAKQLQMDVSRQQKEKSQLERAHSDLIAKLDDLEEKYLSAKEKVGMYEFGLVTGEEKLEATTIEKLRLEKDLIREKNEREELELASNKAMADCLHLQDQVDTISEMLNSCQSKLRSKELCFEEIQAEKRKLEEYLQHEIEVLNTEKNTLKEENDDFKSKVDVYAKELDVLKGHLALLEGNNNNLELKLRHSEKEWRDVCVQAEMLAQTAEVEDMGTQTLGKHTSRRSVRSANVGDGPIFDVGDEELDNCAGGHTSFSDKSREFQEGSRVEKDMVSSTIKKIFAEVRTSLEEKDEALAMARIYAEREIKDLRLHLSAAEKEISLIKKSVAPIKPLSVKTKIIGNDRLLRIQAAKEKAGLAAAHHERLAFLGNGKTNSINDIRAVRQTASGLCQGDTISNTRADSNSLLGRDTNLGTDAEFLPREKFIRYTSHREGNVRESIIDDGVTAVSHVETFLGRENYEQTTANQFKPGDARGGLWQKDNGTVGATEGIVQNEYEQSYREDQFGNNSLTKSIADLQEKHQVEKTLLKTKYRERFRCMSRGWEEEKRAIISVLEKDSVCQQGGQAGPNDSLMTPNMKRIVFVPTPATSTTEWTQRTENVTQTTARNASSAKTSFDESFQETEAFVLNVLNSCRKD